MKKSVGLITLLLLASVSAFGKQSHTDHNPTIALQIGTNRGGINDFTDLCLLDQNRVPIHSMEKAFEKGTHSGFNLGIHVNQHIRQNQIEIGLAYMNNAQTYKYTDASDCFIGLRSIDVKQFMVPISYNISMFRLLFPNSDIQLKLGYLWQFNVIDALGTGSIPDYFINTVSKGGTLGISAYLLKFGHRFKIGVFGDLYRGSHLFSNCFGLSCFPTSSSYFLKSGIRILL